MPSQEIEKRKIDALYYLYNQGLPAIKDESSFQKIRKDFFSLFPEFSKDISETFDPAEVEPAREKIHDILRQLPREKKVWAEELAIRTSESLDLAHKALTRNMREFLNEEFPRPLDGESAINAHKKLANKLAELMINLQSMPLAKREEYSRAEMEVVLAWDIVLMNALLLAMYKESTVDPNEFFCLMYQIGNAHGFLMTLDPNRVEILKEAYSRIKGSETVGKRWKLQQDKKEEAARIADAKWNTGDKALHTEMADFLCNSAKHPEIEGLSRSEILDAIKPVAKKHDRVFGMKGVKKEKDK